MSDKPWEKYQKGGPWEKQGPTMGPAAEGLDLGTGDEEAKAEAEAILAARGAPNPPSVMVNAAMLGLSAPGGPLVGAAGRVLPGAFGAAQRMAGAYPKVSGAVVGAIPGVLAGNPRAAIGGAIAGATGGGVGQLAAKMAPKIAPWAEFLKRLGSRVQAGAPAMEGAAGPVGAEVAAVAPQIPPMAQSPPTAPAAPIAMAPRPTLPPQAMQDSARLAEMLGQKAPIPAATPAWPSQAAVTAPGGPPSIPFSLSKLQQISQQPGGRQLIKELLKDYPADLGGLPPEVKAVIEKALKYRMAHRPGVGG